MLDVFSFDSVLSMHSTYSVCLFGMINLKVVVLFCLKNYDEEVKEDESISLSLSLSRLIKNANKKNQTFESTADFIHIFTERELKKSKRKSKRNIYNLQLISILQNSVLLNAQCLSWLINITIFPLLYRLC